MRIAWIIYGPLEQTSGGYIYDRKVIEGLHDLGELVDVISVERGRACASITLKSYDVLVADELCFAEIGPLFRGLSSGPLRVLLVHHLTAWESSAEEQPGVLALEREALAAADICVATSRPTGERLVAEGLAREVSIAEPGADRLPRLASREAEVLRLLFVGNLSPRKGVLELLAAFSELDAPSAELVLVGDGGRDPIYAAEVDGAVRRSAKLSRQVRVTGVLDEQALAREFAGASALVLPSTLEGYGIVLGEALHAGVPLIAAEVGAAAELIERTQAGLSFAPGDPSALSSALTEFSRDEGLRSKLRARARAAAATLPTWSQTVGTFGATLARAC